MVRARQIGGRKRGKTQTRKENVPGANLVWAPGGELCQTHCLVLCSRCRRRNKANTEVRGTFTLEGTHHWGYRARYAHQKLIQQTPSQVSLSKSKGEGKDWDIKNGERNNDDRKWPALKRNGDFFRGGGKSAKGNWIKPEKVSNLDDNAPLRTTGGTCPRNLLRKKKKKAVKGNWARLCLISETIPKATGNHNVRREPQNQKRRD